MNNDIFYSQEQIDHAISSFRDLLNHPGYQLMKRVVDANIEFVSSQILEGIENETKETIDRLRDKLKVYKDVINTPQAILDRLEMSAIEAPSIDPYDTVESLKKDRGQDVDSEE